MKNNQNNYSRREFVKISGVLGLAGITGVSPAMAFAKDKKFRIGSTYILWGYSADNLEPALIDMSALGFHSFETFGFVIQEWEENRGGFSEVVAKYNIPITSAFCMTDVLDPSKRKDELAKLKKWAEYLRDAGGTVVEYCPSSIKRGQMNYDYKEHKKNLVESMNDYAKLVNDVGLTCALHPHTGTPIETEEEVYFIMDNLDTPWRLPATKTALPTRGWLPPPRRPAPSRWLRQTILIRSIARMTCLPGSRASGNGRTTATTTSSTNSSRR